MGDFSICFSEHLTGHPNKLLALVGLSMCQYLLGDGYNSRQTLNKVKDVKLTRAEIAKYWALQFVTNFSPVGTLITCYVGWNPLEARKHMFDIQKEKALTVNQNLLQ